MPARLNKKKIQRGFKNCKKAHKSLNAEGLLDQILNF